MSRSKRSKLKRGKPGKGEPERDKSGI